MDIDPERVVTVLKDPAMALAVLRHERNQRVHDAGGSFYYDDSVSGKQAIPLSGLLPRIHDTYGLREFSAIKRAPSGGAGVTKRKKKGKAAKTDGKGSRFGGLIKGTFVHQDMRDFVMYDAKNYNRTHRQSKKQTDGHRLTTRLMEFIVARQKWMPFLPEFLMFDEQLGVGTRVDMVCVNKQGDLVLLEYKTGYAGYFDQAQGVMTRSLAGLPNTPRQRATLQITVPALILNRRYGIPLRRMHLWVLRVDDAQLDPQLVPPLFVEQYGDAIYNDLLLYNQYERKTKKKSKTTAGRPQ